MEQESANEGKATYVEAPMLLMLWDKLLQWAIVLC